MHASYEPREVDLVWELEFRHFEEAEFALEVRADALDAPHYTLDELAKGIEARLLAHVDGLAVAGPVVEERLLVPTFHDADEYPKRVAVAVLACTEPRAAVEALAEVDTEDLAQGLVRGLVLRDDHGLDTQLVQALRRRHDLALELAARSGGTIHLATRALTRVQYRQLGQITRQPAWTGLEFQRGLPIR